jgi:hypothetical protein
MFEVEVFLVAPNEDSSFFKIALSFFNVFQNFFREAVALVSGYPCDFFQIF